MSYYRYLMLESIKLKAVVLKDQNKKTIPFIMI